MRAISQIKVEPKCFYFGSCGGCAYQDLDYAEQLELKKNQVEEAVHGLNGFSSYRVNSVIPSPKPYHYRHMIALSVKKSNGALRFGFMGQDRKTLIPIDSCAITDERINEFLPRAYAKLEELPPQRRYRTSQTVLRVGENGEVVTSLRTDRGKKLECTIAGKNFSYSVSSFFQHNYSILEAFVESIRSFLKPDSKGILFDLYSGVGLFSILFADLYEQVIGIEEGWEAIQHAKQNAERNGARTISFFEGKVEVLLPDLISKICEASLHVIVDPPRAGLKPEVIECLLKLPIDRLVYVSCHLEALKRDLALLVSSFKISEVQPIDLFPQTKHIETVVLLEPLSALRGPSTFLKCWGRSNP